MSPAKNHNEICPFVEHLVGEKVVFKEIIDNDFSIHKIQIWII